MTQFGRSASVNYFTPGSTGIYLSDFRIVFDVNKNSDNEFNKARIEIYNLSEKTRNEMDVKKDEGAQVHVNAGYVEGDGEEEAFNGDVTQVTHKLTPPDFVTIISAQDGHKALTKTKTKLSFDAGASAMEIFKKVVDEFPIPNTLKNVIINNKYFANGFSFSGSNKDAMDKLSEYLNLEWSVQNGVVTIINKNGDDGSRAVSLSPSTGLIGSPERYVDAERKAKGKTTKETKGWRLTALLQPKIQVPNKIAVTSREIPSGSFFTVESIDHHADTHGVAWNSEIKVRE